MKIDERMLELLYRSFDDDLSASERAELETALAESEDLRKENARIAGMRKALAASGAKGFGYMFTERVMRRIEAERAGSEERSGSEEPLDLPVGQLGLTPSPPPQAADRSTQPPLTAQKRFPGGHGRHLPLPRSQRLVQHWLLR